MTDWAVWPIFTAQLIAFILLLVPSSATVKALPFSLRHITAALILCSCIMILASLYHDATETLPFYF